MIKFSSSKLLSRFKERPYRILTYVVLLILSIFFIVQLLFSLGWGLSHDTPLLHYVAFLHNEHDFSIYKDVFETSMPGTFIFHIFITKVFGYSNLAFRLVDLTVLSLILIITWKILIKIGNKTAASFSIIFFGLIYLKYDQVMSLQRDYLAIIPISLAILIAIKENLSLKMKFFAIGILFGTASMIKPHLAIGLIPLFLYVFRKDSKVSLRRSSFFFLFTILGFALPIISSLLWLWQQGSLSAFIDMLNNYLPLHIQLSGDHRILHTSEQLPYYVVNTLKFGGLTLLMIPTIYSAYKGIKHKNKDTILIISMSISYLIYVILAGQFWLYHWMPFTYFTILLISRIISEEEFANTHLYNFALIIILAIIYVRPSLSFSNQIQGKQPVSPEQGRVEDLAKFILENSKSNEKIQVLDWTGGGIHALLNTKRELATKYMYNYHFYHHVSDNYIQKMRQEFINQLKDTRPKIIIEVHKTPKVSGVDTTTHFLELQELLMNNYYKNNSSEDFTIYKLKD